MSDFFKKITKSGLPVALSVKDEGSLFVGFVENQDDEFLFVKLMSPSARFDGWACVRVEEIARADVATEYLKTMAMVYEYEKVELPLPKISSRDILASFIDYLIKGAVICTVEVGFETLDKLTGRFIKRNFDTVEMRIVSSNGDCDGLTSFDFEEIVYITAEGEREAYLEKVLDILAQKRVAALIPSVEDNGSDSKKDNPGKTSGKAEAGNGKEVVKEKGKKEKADESGRVITFPKKNK